MAETVSDEHVQAAISIPSAWDLDWIPLDTSRDGNVPGPVWKVLRDVPEKTYVIHLPPGWRDDVVDWHPAVEESFKLAGVTEMPGNRLEKWCYMYRPPGILHGPALIPTDAGSTSIQRMSGDLRILRYDGDEFPHVHLQPITDEHKTWPVPWNEHLDLLSAPWEPVEDGPWAGVSIKWAHRNRVTHGGAVLLQIPAGWSGAGSSARGPIEEFVVEGTMRAGDDEYGKWGYLFRPRGAPVGQYSSDEGAVLFCWWDEADELAA